MTYIVEFFGPKGWEIAYEGDDRNKANMVLDACLDENFDSRLTINRN